MGLLVVFRGKPCNTENHTTETSIPPGDFLVVTFKALLGSIAYMLLELAMNDSVTGKEDMQRVGF